MRNVIDDKSKDRTILVGVDASTKMLEIARKCTATKGCGLQTTTAANKPNENNDDEDPKLYDALIDLNLEEMTLENTLCVVPLAQRKQQGRHDFGLDLIAADVVFVYFGILETILEIFSGLHTNGSNNAGILVLICERTSLESTLLGYTLMETGRFVYTNNNETIVFVQIGEPENWHVTLGRSTNIIVSEDIPYVLITRINNSC